MEKMPVFVKIDEYEDVIETMENIKSKIASAKQTLAKINQLKQEEDAQLQSWHTAMGEVETRLKAINQHLHEPEYF